MKCDARIGNVKMKRCTGILSYPTKACANSKHSVALSRPEKKILFSIFVYHCIYDSQQKNRHRKPIARIIRSVVGKESHFDTC